MASDGTSARGVKASRGNLIWMVPLLAIAGGSAFVIGLLGWCGDDALGCRGDATSMAASIGPGVLLILCAAALMWALFRVVPWSASPTARQRTSIAVGLGYLALVIAYVLLTGLWPR